MLHSQRTFNNPYPEPNLSSSEALYEVSEQRRVLQCKVVSLTSNPQAGGSLLFGCPANLYIGRPTPHPQPRGRAMPW